VGAHTHSGSVDVEQRDFVTSELTPIIILLEKLTVAQLVKKFSAFY
jgi:hypothetical protein